MCEFPNNKIGSVLIELKLTNLRTEDMLKNVADWVKFIGTMPI